MRKLLIASSILILMAVMDFSAEVSVAVSPIRVEHIVKQGERGTDMISVTNNGTMPVRLKVSLEEWTLSLDGNPIFSKPANAPYSCAAWIKINPFDFRLEPGQTKDVRYTVSVPADIPDGGYRAAIVFETIPDVKPGQAVKKVYIQGRIATILYEKVGNPEIKGYVKNLKVQTSKEGIDFIINIENAGKVHFRTKGKITVKDGEGRKVFEVNIPDIPVLPESTRDVIISYRQPMAKGAHTALAVIDIGQKELIGAETNFIIE